jgi:hypothetical protein
MPRQVGLISVCVIASLSVVGIASGTELRHAIQSIPLLLVVGLAARRAQAARPLALPMFVFWLGIMMLIWLYLLDWVPIASGDFSGPEIAMTIVVGCASIGGIVAAARGWRFATGAPLFVLGAALQVVAFWGSLQPSIANR